MVPTFNFHQVFICKNEYGASWIAPDEVGKLEFFSSQK